MEQILNYLSIFSLPKITFLDIIEILILAIILYKIIEKLIYTRVWIVVKGIIIILGLYLIAVMCSFQLISILLQGALALSAIALILVFQPEIKRFLEDLGNKKITLNMFKKNKTNDNNYYSTKTIDELIIAIEEMSKQKTGALIVFEKDIPLTEYINTGIPIQAKITSQLLINIFEKNTPLHDGAVIFKNNKIEAASCYLKLSENNKIDKKLGTRHRAGIGISETTDSIVVIVSEETGNVTFVQKHKYTSVNMKKLKELLLKNQKKEFFEDQILKKIKNKKKTTQHFFIKIASFIFVFIFWIVIVNIKDPISTSYYNIPINIINDNVLSELGQTYQSLNNEKIKVAISARKSILTHLKEEDVIAEADIQKLSITNAVPINLYIKDIKDDSYSIKSNVYSINLKLEELVQIEVPIELNITGEVKTGFALYSTKLGKEFSNITLPQSLAKTIEKAVLEVELNNEEKDFNCKGIPKIYDKNGNSVNVENILPVEVSLLIGKIKNIPIYINLSEELNNKYNIQKVDFSPKNINIVGAEKDLTNINDIIVLLNTELSEETNITLKTLDITLPDNIKLLDEKTKLNISITTDNIKTKKINIVEKDISLLNKNDKFKYDISVNPLKTEIKGTSKSLNKETFDIYLDLKELKQKGTYPVQLQLKDKNVIFVEPPIVIVNVTN